MKEILSTIKFFWICFLYTFVYAMFCGASNAAKLTINARSDLLDGVGAKMQIYVEGKLIFTKDIHHTDFQNIVIDAPEFVPGARVDVYFGNDAFAYGQDRNLFIKSISFNTNILKLSDARYDRGNTYALASDGKDVISGQQGMWWNGALKFTLPSTKTINVSCVGDGITDDRQCLHDAINTPDADLIVFPSNKTYYISAGIDVASNRVIYGNNSQISTQSVDMRIPTGNSAYIFQLIGSKSISIVGFKFNFVSNNKNFYGPLHIGKNSQGIRVVNNFFTGKDAAAAIFIDGKDVKDLHINNNMIDGTRYGILINAINLGADKQRYPSNITIDSNKILNVSADAIEINSPVRGGSNIPGVAVNQVNITNNTLSVPFGAGNTSGFCIGVAGALNVTIKANKMFDCRLQGIHVEDYAEYIDISLNEISNTLGKREDAGILLLSRANRINIYRNKIHKSAAHGILVSWDGKDNYVHDLVISENTISDSSKAAILIGAMPNQPMNSIIGATNGYQGNITRNSGIKNDQRVGIIVASGTKGVTLSGNVGD